MVDVVRDSVLQFGSCFRICFLQFSYLGTLFLIEFFSVHTFKNWLCGIVLRKEVVTEATFSPLLQSGAIGTVSAQVIFPRHVVQALGIITSAGNHIIRIGSTGLNRISSRTVCFHRSRENNLLVIRHLIRHLLTVFAKYYNLGRISQFQFGYNVTHRNFHHFIRAL